MAKIPRPFLNKNSYSHPDHCKVLILIEEGYRRNKDFKDKYLKDKRFVNNRTSNMQKVGIITKNMNRKQVNFKVLCEYSIDFMTSYFDRLIKKSLNQMQQTYDRIIGVGTNKGEIFSKYPEIGSLSQKKIDDIKGLDEHRKLLLKNLLSVHASFELKHKTLIEDFDKIKDEIDKYTELMTIIFKRYFHSAFLMSDWYGVGQKNNKGKTIYKITIDEIILNIFKNLDFNKLSEQKSFKSYEYILSILGFISRFLNVGGFSSNDIISPIVQETLKRGDIEN